MRGPKAGTLLLLYLSACHSEPAEPLNPAIGPIQSILGDRLSPEVAGGVGGIEDYGATDAHALEDLGAPNAIDESGADRPGEGRRGARQG